MPNRHGLPGGLATLVAVLLFIGLSLIFFGLSLVCYNLITGRP